jgi:hypothetical protein
MGGPATKPAMTADLADLYRLTWLLMRIKWRTRRLLRLNRHTKVKLAE